MKKITAALLFCAPFLLFGQQPGLPKVNVIGYKKSRKVQTRYPIAWERSVRYIGPLRDSIIIIDSPNLTFKPGNPFETNLGLRKYYGTQHFLTTPVEVTIDTTQIISASDFSYRANRLDKKTFQSFPVFIKNTTDSLASIGFGSKVNIILEGLDTDNTWKPIEKRFVYKCGFGMHYIYLNPGETCCTLVTIYEGDFPTLLRLHINNSYSEPFEGHIQKSQFIE